MKDVVVVSVVACTVVLGSDKDAFRPISVIDEVASFERRLETAPSRPRYNGRTLIRPGCRGRRRGRSVNFN